MVKKLTILLLAAIAIGCIGCESAAQRKAKVKQQHLNSTRKLNLQMARELLDTGDFNRALEIVQQCLSHDPTNAEGHLLHGWALVGSARWLEAQDALQKAIELNPDAHLAYYFLAIVGEKQAQDAAVVRDYYERALALQPSQPDYVLDAARFLAKYDPMEAKRLLTDCSMELKNDVEFLEEAAGILLVIKENKQAIYYYEIALSIDPENLDVAQSLAYAYMFEKHWAQAEGMFVGLANLATESEDKYRYWEAAGQSAMNGGHYLSAADHYTNALLEKRRDAQAWLQLGQAWLGAEKQNDAIACARKALLFDGDNTDAMILLGCALYADAQYAAAMETFEMLPESAVTPWIKEMQTKIRETLGVQEETEETLSEVQEETLPVAVVSEN